MATVPINKYKVGSTNIVKQQRGNDNVNKMYMGNDLVYQKLSFAPTLSTSVSSMEFKYSGDTAQTVTVNSNTDWSYSTNVNWLTLTKSGNILSVLPQDYTSELENRTATVTITADNGDMQKSKTIAITQKKVEKANYVAWVTQAGDTGSNWNTNNSIDTGIAHTSSTMSVRVKYIVKDTYSDRIVGYQQGNGLCSSDSNDFRIFSYSSGSFDMWSDRHSSLHVFDSAQEYDLTMGDNYVYNNINSTYLYQGNAYGSVPTPNCHIYVDVCALKLKEVIIKDGDTVLFDGKAAYDDDNHVGLYDEVSEQYVYNSNLTMTYGEL